MGILAVQRFGYSLSIISKVLKNRVAEELFESLRQARRVNGIHAQQAYRPAVRALRRQELVGFMLDQQRPASQGVFVDFFGRLASTSPGLAFMSAATGAPVVPVFIRRKASGGHILEALPLMEPPPDREEETIRQHTAVYTKIIEEQVRRTPAQWLWLHKRWKSRPLERGQRSEVGGQGTAEGGGRGQRSEVRGGRNSHTDGHGRLEGAESRGQGGTGTASALSERSYRGEPMGAGEVADGGA